MFNFNIIENEYMFDDRFVILKLNEFKNRLFDKLEMFEYVQAVKKPTTANLFQTLWLLISFLTFANHQLVILKSKLKL